MALRRVGYRSQEKGRRLPPIVMRIDFIAIRLDQKKKLLDIQLIENVVSKI
jgi:hypothetical protein